MPRRRASLPSRETRSTTIDTALAASLESGSDAGVIQRQNASFPSWTSPVRFRSPAPMVIGGYATARSPRCDCQFSGLALTPLTQRVVLAYRGFRDGEWTRSPKKSPSDGDRLVTGMLALRQPSERHPPSRSLRIPRLSAPGRGTGRGSAGELHLAPSSEHRGRDVPPSARVQAGSRPRSPPDPRCRRGRPRSGLARTPSGRSRGPTRAGRACGAA